MGLWREQGRTAQDRRHSLGCRALTQARLALVSSPEVSMVTGSPTVGTELEPAPQSELQDREGPRGECMLQPVTRNDKVLCLVAACNTYFVY